MFSSLGCPGFILNLVSATVKLPGNDFVTHLVIPWTFWPDKREPNSQIQFMVYPKLLGHCLITREMARVTYYCNLVKCTAVLRFQ